VDFFYSHEWCGDLSTGIFHLSGDSVDRGVFFNIPLMLSILLMFLIVEISEFQSSLKRLTPDRSFSITGTCTFRLANGLILCIVCVTSNRDLIILIWEGKFMLRKTENRS